MGGGAAFSCVVIDAPRGDSLVSCIDAGRVYVYVQARARVLVCVQCEKGWEGGSSESCKQASQQRVGLDCVHARDFLVRKKAR